MPDKVTPKKIIKKPVFSDLTPTQVRITNLYEVGDKFNGSLGELVSTSCEGCQKCEGCQSCQTCEGCESCQKSGIDFGLDKEIGFNSTRGATIKFARKVTYELVDSDHDSCKLKQTKVVFEMSNEAFEKITDKDKFVEIGTSETGLKQYTMKD